MGAQRPLEATARVSAQMASVVLNFMDGQETNSLSSSLSLFGIADLVRPGSFSLLSSGVGTNNPACQLKWGRVHG